MKNSGPPFTIDRYKSFYERAIAELDWLRQELADYKQEREVVLNDLGACDEVLGHCSCVPVLRLRIKDLETAQAIAVTNNACWKELHEKNEACINRRYAELANERALREKAEKDADQCRAVGMRLDRALRLCIDEKLAIVKELAEAKRDTARLNWWFEQQKGNSFVFRNCSLDSFREYIDTQLARESK